MSEYGKRMMCFMLGIYTGWGILGATLIVVREGWLYK